MLKSTYPPPADGPCVLFLCKSGCSANEPAAQAGRGPLQGIGDCTECKVLQGSEARLHSSAKVGHGRGIAGVPGSIGRKLLKRGFRWGFKNSHCLFCGGLAGCGERLTVLQVTSGGAVACLADCTELNTIEDQLPLLQSISAR